MKKGKIDMKSKDSSWKLIADIDKLKEAIGYCISKYINDGYKFSNLAKLDIIQLLDKNHYYINEVISLGELLSTIKETIDEWDYELANENDRLEQWLNNNVLGKYFIKKFAITNKETGQYTYVFEVSFVKSIDNPEYGTMYLNVEMLSIGGRGDNSRFLNIYKHMTEPTSYYCNSVVSNNGKTTYSFPDNVTEITEKEYHSLYDYVGDRILESNGYAEEILSNHILDVG